MSVLPEEISVVVQGPVIGASSDPPEKRFTLRSLQSLRRHLPGAQIMLSTWIGSDLHGLPIDIAVENEDPGTLDLGSVNDMLRNTNRQIVSTRNGLRRAERKYAMKLRSDTMLSGVSSLDYIGKFDSCCSSWKILRQRVIVSSIVSQNPLRNPVPLNPSDFFHLGLTEDLLNIREIPLIPEPESGSGEKEECSW